MAITTIGAIKTLTVGVMAAGAIYAGITWTGGTTLNQAKTTIADYAQKLNIFETNENTLVTKINTLKSEKAALQDQLAQALDKGDADDATIADLQAQIAAKDAEIAQLQTDLEAANNEIARLEGELNTANTQATELQTTIDSNISTAVPLTTTELDAVTKEAQPALTYHLGDPQIEVFPGVTISTSGTDFKVMNMSGADINVNWIPNGDWNIVYHGNYKFIGSASTTSITITQGSVTKIVTIN